MSAGGVAFGEAVRFRAWVAHLSFGGPAGQIAVTHRILLDNRRFLRALNFCILLPWARAAAARRLSRLPDAPDLGRLPAVPSRHPRRGGCHLRRVTFGFDRLRDDAS
ncbi:hypothetical protein [Roseitranquillus sediminis]|uniref:hypothetical protein n=1 Tax=Roseitranquillus sediminis TaxID=2809051 RepID=UPI003872AA39